MKLHKRTFRSVPNPMFVQKSQEAVEGGTDLKFNEIQFTNEEVSDLFITGHITIDLTDERYLKVKESDIIKVTSSTLNGETFVNLIVDSYALTFVGEDSVLIITFVEEDSNCVIYLNVNEFLTQDDVDMSLDDTSFNPIANSVVTNALGSKQDSLPDTTGEEGKFLKVGDDGLEWDNVGGGGGSSLYEHRIVLSFYNSDGWDGHLTFTIINSSSTAITFSGLKTYLYVENPPFSSMLSATGLIRVNDLTPYFMLIMGIEDTDSEDTVYIRAVDLNAYSADSSEPLAYPIYEEEITIYDTIKQIS